MKVRTTLRSILILFIAIASVVCIILPYLNISTILGDLSTPFYDLLKFEKYIYTIDVDKNQTLNLLREISSYLVIAVIAAGALSFFMSLTRIVFYKNKAIGAINGLSNFLLMVATLGLGVISVVHVFMYASAINELGGSSDMSSLSSIGGWVYCGLGLATPVIIVFTNFIKK